MLPGTCNCDLFARTQGSFCGNLHEQSSFFDGFFAFHSSSFHTSGYLVPNCRLFPYFFDNRVGYLCGIDCTSSWRGLDEWNEGKRLDRQIKKRGTPRTWQSHYQWIPEQFSTPTYAIHSPKDSNTQRTPYLRSGISETAPRRWRTQAKQELGHCYIPSRERRQTGKKAGGANRKAQLCGTDQSSVPLLSLYKKSLREARRAKPLMSWRRLYLRKSAKLRFRMSFYILSIERQLIRKACIPLFNQSAIGRRERRLQKCF